MKHTIPFTCNSQLKYLPPVADHSKASGGVLCWAEVTLSTPTCHELTGSS